MSVESRTPKEPEVSERVVAVVGVSPNVPSPTDQARSETSGTPRHRHLEAVHDCPMCGGTGRWQPSCEHDWRLVTSAGGQNFNLQNYICMNDGCEATTCSDCRADGFETCQEAYANGK